MLFALVYMSMFLGADLIIHQMFLALNWFQPTGNASRRWQGQKTLIRRFIPCHLPTGCGLELATHLRLGQLLILRVPDSFQVWQHSLPCSHNCFLSYLILCLRVAMPTTVANLRMLQHSMLVFINSVHMFISKCFYYLVFPWIWQLFATLAMTFI